MEIRLASDKLIGGAGGIVPGNPMDPVELERRFSIKAPKAPAREITVEEKGKEAFWTTKGDILTRCESL